MQHVQEGLPCQATFQMQLQGTRDNQYLFELYFWMEELTNPNDLMTSVQVPMKRLITKPPRTVLISGIPLCFAYKAYSFTNTLADRANTI